MKKFTLIFFCQSVDQDDPIIADTANRAISFAKNPRVKKTIIFTTRGKSILPDPNITTINLQAHKNGRIKSLFPIYKTLFSEVMKGRVLLYCYMTPTLPILFLPFKIFPNFKIATWFCHSYFSPLVKFNLKFISNLWFASNKGLAKLNYSNLHIVGHAVDFQLFRPMDTLKKYDLILVGRLTAVKKIHTVIEALHILKTTYNQSISLCVCGDSYSGPDTTYKNDLKILISKYQLDSQVFFKGSILKSDLPLFLNQSKIFIFPQAGAIAKATVEALSTGLPIIICEDASDFLSSYLNQLFVANPDASSLAQKINQLLSLSTLEYSKLSKQCREDVIKNGGLDELFNRISHQIEKEY